MIRQLLWSAGAVLVATSFGCSQPAEQSAGQNAPTPGALTPAEARTLARDAYVFGFPAIYIAKQQEMLTNVAKPEGTRAPFNQFAHYRSFPDPTNRTVVLWNVDTLYLNRHARSDQRAHGVVHSAHGGPLVAHAGTRPLE